MLKNKKVCFRGACGHYYTFTYYAIDAVLPALPAVYIFVRQTVYDYEALYIGETETLASCREQHIIACVWKLYPNAICVYLENDATVRCEMTRDLIACQTPPCNMPQP